MKKVINFKYATILLVLAGVFSSCLKNSEPEPIGGFYWEIPRNGKNSVINNRIDGIEFKFCLLNEKGVPATRFKQGEDFSFHFEMINHRRDRLYTYTNGLECDNMFRYFGQVISQEQDTIFTRSAPVCTLGSATLPFYGKDNKREMTVHCREIQHRIRFDENNHLKQETFQMPDLPAGEYYTEFLSEFKFIYYAKTACEPEHYYYIGPVTFKINFKIE